MNINITEAEFEAICLAISEIETNIEEGADDEYIEAYTPALRDLDNITAKYKKALATKERREALYRELKAMYPHEVPVTLKRVVSRIMKQERKGEKPW